MHLGQKLTTSAFLKPLPPSIGKRWQWETPLPPKTWMAPYYIDLNINTNINSIYCVNYFLFHKFSLL